MDEKFGRNNHRHEKSGGSIEKANPCLLADIGKMTEIPRNEIIDFVKRGKCDVKRVSYKLSMKNSA